MVALKKNNKSMNVNKSNKTRADYDQDDLSSATSATLCTLLSSSEYESQLLLDGEMASTSTPTQSQNSKVTQHKMNHQSPKRVQVQSQTQAQSPERGSSCPSSKHQMNNHAGQKVRSVKPHDAPMKRRDIYFALDCEMVGVGQDGLDSALARVSIVNWDDEIVLDTFVKVDEPVTDYRTFVSGITAEQIESDSAMTLNQVQHFVSSILRGKILIGHGLENDLKAIGIYHPLCDIRDTAKYTPFMRQVESRSSSPTTTMVASPSSSIPSNDGKATNTTFCARKLKDLVAEKLGRQIQVYGKAHSPIEDALAAMDLYKAVRNQWEMDITKQVHLEHQVVNNNYHPHVHPARQLNQPMSPPRLNNFYNQQQQQHFNHSYGMAVPHQPIQQQHNRLDVARMAHEQARMRAAAAYQQYQFHLMQQQQQQYYPKAVIGRE